MQHQGNQPSKRLRSSYEQGVGSRLSETGLYELMTAPTTPRKKGERINQIIVEINNRWNLDLPIQTSLETPSQTSRSSERDIYRLIKFLYFQDEESLNKAIHDFDSHALSIHSEWIFKPRGERETLPSHTHRYPALNGDQPQQRRELTSGDKSNLISSLLHFLKLARDNPSGDTALPSHSMYRSSPRSSQRRQPTEYGSGSLLSTHGTAGPDNIRRSLFSPRVGADDQHGKSNITTPIRDPQVLQENAKAKNFTPSPATYRSLRYLDISNTPRHDSVLTSVTHVDGQPNNEDDGMEDVFTTPPESPLRDPLYENLDTSFYQQVDEVTLPSTTMDMSRKHTHTQLQAPELSRKLSREMRADSPRSHRVNHYKAATVHEPPTFESFSTTSPGASTTWTSPNASFRTESTSVSFGSGTMLVGHQPMKSAIRDEAMYDDIQSRGNQHNDVIEVDQLSLGSNDTELVESGPLAGMTPTEYVRYSLVHENPFNHDLLRVDRINQRSSPSFRVLYETSRVALHCGIPTEDLFESLINRNKQTTDDYGELWSNLSNSVSKCKKTLPDRCHPAAWKGADARFDNVTLSGALQYMESPGGAVFRFQLKPLKQERSYRLSRKYGSDRFLVVGLPSLEEKDLPQYLKNDAKSVRMAIIEWIDSPSHYLLGRTWRAFFPKRQEHSKTGANATGFRVYLFATSGPGLQTIPIEKMLEWFIPFKENRNQPILKLYSRLQLAVSNTTPTVEFKYSQVVYTYDASSNAPGKRCLFTDRIKKDDWRNSHKSRGAVMNDGCARISQKAARLVVDKLGLGLEAPSAFQGRIGGAKGVWITDPSNELNAGDDIWIEITESQLKFKGHAWEKMFPDPHRLTLDVVSWSKPLKSASLNYQLMPILESRGVNPEIFTRLLVEALTDKTANLKTAMSSGLELRLWNQENGTTSAQRVNDGCIEWIGGLPRSDSEQINMLVEHGFKPRTCIFLRDLCYKAIQAYCQDLEKSLHIEIGRSTLALMVADPLGILEEDEIHLGFGSTFIDPKSRFSDTMLHGIDVLVARNPALLPSDIQRVRAVFKPELAGFKDAIVFPTTGKVSLADKLSGGDYDGDKAWVCWDPELVQNFRNCEVPKKPNLDFYNIKTDTEKTGEALARSADFASYFIRRGLDFNLHGSMLGVVTAYHESLSYSIHRDNEGGEGWRGTAKKNGSNPGQVSRKDPINNDFSIAVASLCGLLVDSAKAGFVFEWQDWDRFKRNNAPRPGPLKPAYRNVEISETSGPGRHPTKAWNSTHVLDRLQQEAKRVRGEVLQKFNHYFNDVSEVDFSLVALIRTEESEGIRDDPALGHVLDDMKERIRKIQKYWILQCKPRNIAATASSKTTSISYEAMVEKVREDFLRIMPLEDTTSPSARRWRRELKSTAHLSAEYSFWTLLKASTLYSMFKTGAFPWYVCGKELARIKAATRPNASSVVSGMYEIFKPNSKMKERWEAKRVGMGGQESGDDDWELDDGVGDRW